MAKRKILTLLCLAFSVLSCSKTLENTNEVRLQTKLDIPAGLNTLETHFFFVRNINTFYQENLQKFGLSDVNISKITGSSITLNSLLSNVDLNFISRISVLAVSKNAPIIEKEMFYLDQVQLSQGKSMQLLTALSDVKSILSQNKFDLELRINFRSPPPTNVTIDIDFGYYLYQ